MGITSGLATNNRKEIPDDLHGQVNMPHKKERERERQTKGIIYEQKDTGGEKGKDENSQIKRDEDVKGAWETRSTALLYRLA